MPDPKLTERQKALLSRGLKLHLEGSHGFVSLNWIEEEYQALLDAGLFGDGQVWGFGITPKGRELAEKLKGVKHEREGMETHEHTACCREGHLDV